MDPTRLALEANLADNPDDLVAHAAYADWLIEHGDSRGEYIRGLVALYGDTTQSEERNQQRTADALALAEYANLHEAEWLGPLDAIMQADWLPPLTPEVSSKHQNVVITVKWGWIYSLLMQWTEPAFWHALINCPVARLMRQLTVHECRHWTCEDNVTWTEHLRLFPALRTLKVSVPGLGDTGTDRLVSTGILSQLTELQLTHCGITDVGALALAADPNIRKLRMIDLSWNHITPVGREALAAVGVEVGEQHVLPPSFFEIPRR